MQHIRGSQFILTYGPGAIIEGRRGPRLIPLPNIGLQSVGFHPERFEISDERISEGILQGSRIFRLPSSAELGSANRPVYRTKVFPEWWICSTHWKLFRYRDGCPDCKINGISGQRKWDAVRFVMACPKGHLDDVNWHYAVHIETRGDCRKGRLPHYYDWIARGLSLRDIKVRCPKCGAQARIGSLYNKRDWNCTGRFPEREPLTSSQPDRGDCSENALMILRQASNLRVPDVISVFSLRLYTELHRLLAIREVKTLVLTLKEMDKLGSEEEFRKLLKIMVENKAIGKDTAMSILQHPYDEIKRAIDEVLNVPAVRGYVDVIRDEFDVFWEASDRGAPPVKGGKARVIFEVPEDRIRKNVRGPYGLRFRVAPATRLRTILVQRGYRRYVRRGTEDILDADLVPVCFTDSGGTRWYPGVEMLGEGIFIRLEDSQKLNTEGKAWSAWMSAFRSSHEDYGRFSILQRDREELHPGFVWWHTLSHLLIRVLSADSGYSSAAIRERVYFRVRDGDFAGGLVLYTVQPGEGTMGGLVSQVENFEHILQRAFEMAEICPNDPLCTNHEFRNGRVTGAACYACLFVSETSCEHRNMWLDRNVLLEGVQSG